MEEIDLLYTAFRIFGWAVAFGWLVITARALYCVWQVTKKYQ